MTIDTVPEAVLERLKKLSNLAANNPSENEAQAAAELYQKLLIQYNLDAATVERAGGESGRREEANVEGGFYRYQRELWEAVGDLNFCMCWSQKFWREGGRDRYGRIARRGRRHVVIGRVVNVRSTIALAQYLERTIERVSLERFPDQRVDNRTMSFRQGMAYRIEQRLNEQRQELLRKEIREQNKRANEAKRKGVSTSTALTVSSHAEAEEVANYDFKYGEGAWAQVLADRAESAAAREQAQREYTEWAQANPEEAAAEEKKRRKAARKYRTRETRDDRYKNIDDGAFWAGADAGDKVSLSQQVDAGSNKRIAKR